MRAAALLVLLLATAPAVGHAEDPPPVHKTKPKPAKPAAASKTVAASKPVAPVAPPAVPAAAPPAPALPPPLVVPTRAPVPPVPAVVVADAPGESSEQPSGLRVTFGAGRSDLNPRTDAAIRTLVHAAPPFATTTFTIVAVAPGSEEDPSSPRRLSLARALAVRSILITEGIPSTRIYVRAMGASPAALAGGPPDRADIAVGGATPAGKQGSS